MGTIFAVEYLTLDGVMDEPGWSMPYFNDELFKFQYDNLFGCDALLLGRITYQGFAEVWPARTDEVGFSARMNDIPKYVASTTLTQTSWNATLLQGDVPTAVAKLKESDQKLMLEGSAQLLESLRRHDLIDEYRRRSPHLPSSKQASSRSGCQVANPSGASLTISAQPRYVRTGIPVKVSVMHHAPER